MSQSRLNLLSSRRRRRVPAGAAAFVICAGVLAVAACQGMDRLEPDRALTVSGSERGTLFDATAGPEFRSGGRLTEEIAGRWLRQIESARGDERVQLATQLLREYPEADFIWQVHELVGDAYSGLGQPLRAAEAWERAISMSWPAPDILRLPLTELDLPYQVGWAYLEAGDTTRGAEWLTRATFVSDRPQLEQGLRFLFAETGSPGGDYDDWFRARQTALAVIAPDFELPGYGFESQRLSELPARLTLINFWTPT